MADDAEVRLGEFIDRFDDRIAAIARESRALLRLRFPTALELVYDNYNALAIGYCSGPRQKDCIVSLAVFPKSVALSFYHGASVPDPEGRLSGEGKQNRYVRLETPQVLLEPAVKALIDRAAAMGETPLPTSGVGATVIQSVSAKQRPRRPG